jgi:hypothetical protein
MNNKTIKKKESLKGENNFLDLLIRNILDSVHTRGKLELVRLENGKPYRQLKRSVALTHFFLFETGSHYVAQAGLKLEILLLHLPKC